MRRPAFLTIAVLGILASPVFGQQVNTGVSPIGIGDSFQQSIGTGWSVRGPGWFANFGGGASGGFGFSAQQGSSRSISGTSASLTTLNGAPGYIFSGTLTPFVTEITPIVGTPVVVSESPLHAKLRMAGGVQGLRPPLRLPEHEAAHAPAAAIPPSAHREQMPGGLATKGSSAERGDLSVAEIRRQQTAEDAAQQAELDLLLNEARRLERLGDRRGAAGMYSRAAAKVEGPQRDEFVRKARQLRATK